MIKREEMIDILKSHQTTFRDGSDGEYYDYSAIDSEDFGDVVTELIEKIKKNELETLLEINKMCEESLEPTLFEKWEEVKAALYRNRQDLKITWEFVDWAEKATGEAQIKGVDNKGNIFEATGIMGGGEIVEVYDIEPQIEETVDG